MAKHARPDDEKPWIGPVGMVYFEDWSGKFWRKEANQYAYVGETKLSLGLLPYHYNWYEFYEQMPVGFVTDVGRGIGKHRFVRKTSNSWKWVS